LRKCNTVDLDNLHLVAILLIESVAESSILDAEMLVTVWSCYVGSV